MQEKDPNQKHYFDPIKTSKQREEHLCRFTLDQAFVLWEEGKSEENTQEFLFKSYESKSSLLSLKYNAGLLNKIKGCDLQGKSVLFRTNLGNKKYFSKGKLTLNEDSGLHQIFLNEPIYLAQQRSDYRLEIEPKLMKIKLKVGENELALHDISAGGASLKLDKETSEFLENKTSLNECILIFNKDNFPIPQINVVKRWSIKDEEDGLIEHQFIGFKFDKIDPNVERKISQKIATEARGKEIRKALKQSRDKKSK